MNVGEPRHCETVMRSDKRVVCHRCMFGHRRCEPLLHPKAQQALPLLGHAGETWDEEGGFWSPERLGGLVGSGLWGQRVLSLTCRRTEAHSQALALLWPVPMLGGLGAQFL